MALNKKNTTVVNCFEKTTSPCNYMILQVGHQLNHQYCILNTNVLTLHNHFHRGYYQLLGATWQVHGTYKAGA